ncbi:MAG: trmD [Candidatus Taylorbacteria bacterium]|nr:trmD [Candidatus Taylorbacteria bacterium]
MIQAKDKKNKKGKVARKPAGKPVTFHVVTLFPTAFDSYLGESILKRAIDDKKISVKFYNPRDFTVASGRAKIKSGPMKGKFKKVWSYADRRVDDRAYGGGPGMVIEALPVIKAIDKAVGRKLKAKAGSVRIIFFSPAGRQLDTAYAKELAAPAVAGGVTDIVFVCGRYEGIDARIKEAFDMEDISVGPFVLTGGELPAMLVIDTVARQIPGVLGDFASLEESRIASSDVYTRPETITFKGKKYKVPEVLLSGNHKLIEEWRQSKKDQK